MVTANEATPSAATSTAGESRPSWRRESHRTRPGRMGGSARMAASSGGSAPGGAAGVSACGSARRPLTLISTAPRSSNWGSSVGSGWTDQ